MNCNILRNVQRFKMTSKIPLTRFTHVVDPDQVSLEFEEVQITVPWGHISGKWYGPKHVRPIIGLHGWQDNAGTFDTLAPLLPSHVGFLSIDLPGHGLSSRIPNGMSYNASNNVVFIKLLMKEYNWEKVSIIAHSMSALSSFMFASLFPKQVDMIIALDALKPHILPTHKIPDFLRKRLERLLIADERNRIKSEPPSYKYDELVEKLHAGTLSSIEKDKCHYLLARNIQKSTKFPDQYFFARDNRIKAGENYMLSQEVCLEFAKRIVAPYLLIKATNSSYFEEKKYFDETVAVLQKNPKFELHYVEGTHHVHLNEPEKIATIINPFINKYRPPELVSKL